MLEVKQHHQDSGHTTLLQFTTPLTPKSKWRGQSRERHSLSHLLLPPQETAGGKRTAPLHWNNPYTVLELPEKVWAATFPWGQLVFSPSLLESESELMPLKEMMKNLCSQLSCYNKNSTYEPNFLLFCVCLGNLEQNNTAQHAKISSEAIWLWKSSEAQKKTMTALCSQSARAQIELTGAQQQLWTLILYLKPSSEQICTRVKAPLTPSSPVDPHNLP